MDEDNDAIQMSADSEVVEAIEIASKSGTPLVIQGQPLYHGSCVVLPWFPPWVYSTTPNPRN
jgi:hypothetical protein